MVHTDEFGDWYRALDDTDKESVAYSVELLEQCGVALGYPHSSEIKGSSIALRELRVQSKGRPLRVFYAFDRARDAVLIIGGDKEGQDDGRFYRTWIPVAEKIWKQYLAEREEMERASAPQKKGKG